MQRNSCITKKTHIFFLGGFLLRFLLTYLHMQRESPWMSSSLNGRTSWPYDLWIFYGHFRIKTRSSLFHWLSQRNPDKAYYSAFGILESLKWGFRHYEPQVHTDSPCLLGSTLGNWGMRGILCCQTALLQDRHCLSVTLKINVYDASEEFIYLIYEAFYLYNNEQLRLMF